MAGRHAAPLASWRATATRHAIVSFVEGTTRAGSSHLVPPAHHSAVFDNDGKLWCEKPLPIQADFLLRRVGGMAEQDPSLCDRQPWKAVVEKDYLWLSGVITKHYQGDDRDLQVKAGGLLAAHAGTTIEDFEAAANPFLRSAQNPALHGPCRWLNCCTTSSPTASPTALRGAVAATSCGRSAGAV